MTEQADIFVVIDGLIDSWCERRALKPLRIVLPVYPPTNFLTDGLQQLCDALRDVRAVCKDDLSADELEKVGRVIVALQRGLENR